MASFTLPIFLACILFAKASLTAPLTESSGSVQTNASSHISYVGYVGDPNGRGTASLVISCLLTLVLCVWSALHLNVPLQNESTVHHLFVNVRWIIVGVYAPEMVVFTAWRQWSSAKLLGNLVRELEDVPGKCKVQREFSSSTGRQSVEAQLKWRDQAASRPGVCGAERMDALPAGHNIRGAPDFCGLESEPDSGRINRDKKKPSPSSFRSEWKRCSRRHNGS